MRVFQTTLAFASTLLFSNVHAHTSHTSGAAHTAEHFAIVMVLGVGLAVLCALCASVRR